MTDKQKVFCTEYCKDRNGMRSAIAAGYAVNSAAVTACNLLKHPDVRAHIDSTFSEMYAANKITVEECVNILADIARTEASELYNADGTFKPIHDIPKHARHAIESIKFKAKYITNEAGDIVPIMTPIEVKVTGKQTAIDKILKHLGGYKEDNNQKKPDPIILNINPLGAEADGDDDLS